MRKLWYAGAVVASGVLMFAASPAQADVVPTTGTDSSAGLLPGNSIAPPVGDLLSGAGGYAITQGNAVVSGTGRAATAGTGEALTGAKTAAEQADNGLDRVRRPTNGLKMTVPLDGSRPLTSLQPGTNSPDLAGGLLGTENAQPNLPASDVVGGALPQPGRALGGLPIGGGLLGGGLLGGGLLGGGLPLAGGLMPDGRQTFDAAERPTVAQTESFSGGVPLLGGLGGVLPVNTLPRTLPDGTVPDTSGLPVGGMTILAPASTVTSPAVTAPATAATTQPATTQPATTQPQPSVSASSAYAPSSPAASPGFSAATGAADPRLHEEPVDSEAARHRLFSPNGRPVAGVDRQYN